MQFNISSYVTIAHLNLRKQGGEDDRELAIDVKVKAEGVQPSVLVPIVGADSVEDIMRAFYDKKGEDVLFTGITQIESWAEFKTRHTLSVAGFTVYPEAIKKFKLRPRAPDKRPAADIEFSFTLLEPDRDLVRYLTDNVAEAVHIDIQGEPELDFGESAQTEDKAA